MDTTCASCKKSFVKNNDQYCKDCYELQIFKGQCLNVAATLLPKYTLESSEDLIKRVYDLAKKLFEEGKANKFLSWK